MTIQNQSEDLSPTVFLTFFPGGDSSIMKWSKWPVTVDFHWNGKKMACCEPFTAIYNGRNGQMGSSINNFKLSISKIINILFAERCHVYYETRHAFNFHEKLVHKIQE